MNQQLAVVGRNRIIVDDDLVASAAANGPGAVGQLTGLVRKFRAGEDETGHEEGVQVPETGEEKSAGTGAESRRHAVA